jgi:hypothetical protein
LDIKIPLLLDNRSIAYYDCLSIGVI